MPRTKPHRLAFSEPSLAFLERLAPKLRRQVANKAMGLAEDPHPRASKPLGGVETPNGEQVFRLRSGDYRILYFVRGNPGEIVILDIDHRKDVYR